MKGGPWLKRFFACPHRALSREPAFPRSLQKHCGFTIEALMPAATALANLQAKAPNSSLPAVFKKYSQVPACLLPLLSADLPVQGLTLLSLHVLCPQLHTHWSKYAAWHAGLRCTVFPCSADADVFPLWVPAAKVPRRGAAA